MSNDSIGKTLTVAVLLCLICSIVVSTAAVVLKPLQDENKLLDKKRNILAAAGLLVEGKSVESLFEQVEAKIVNVKTGQFASDEDLKAAGIIDAETFDQRKASKNTNLSFALSSSEDISSIKRQSLFATVYIVRNSSGQLDTIILPVHGYGLWSTLYGFLALEEDANTVVGLGFYEHAETPGLGGEVDNPKWKEVWPGKKVYNATWDVKLGLIKGTVDKNNPGAMHQIDGLSGASLTSRGVSNIVKFWMGEKGFGPFLAALREEGV